MDFTRMPPLETTPDHSNHPSYPSLPSLPEEQVEILEKKVVERDPTTQEPATRKTFNDIEYMLRICRSTGPKEILIKLAVNRHLLVLQISAIKIQSIVRRYIAKMRYLMIKRHVQFFHKITEEFASIFVEEVVISSSLECALSFMKTYRKYLKLNETVNDLVAWLFSELLEEILSEFCYEIVIDIVNTASSNYLLLQR